MLQIKDVRKKYVTGDFEQIALNGVSLNLRDNEFVAILGPSGSGKTTLLNIIGGLDRYDSGDLIINGISTKKYKDRDWDSYRNHTIGFVFQSYNLIPHQTVLANVELALTISGISSKERKQRALDALEKVGLREQAHKKPNQMSGGQMQRVAIARALVNDPKILLADEPTGALDTRTSIQVMDLLKEVAKDRLVVMVTHNPELAVQYANRIVRVKDGNIIDDSNPLIINEDIPAVHKTLGHASMSLLTSFGLSLNNLMTKKGRTFLTAFAGSIGIIGIALILSLSTGFQNYVDQIQEDTMTSYPLTIQKETANIFSALLGLRSDTGEEVDDGVVIEQKMIATMMDSVGSNDLKSFKAYMEAHEDEWDLYVNSIEYAYSVSPLIYTRDVTDSIVQLNPNTVLSSVYSDSATSLMSSLSSSTSMGTFSEMNVESLKENNELVAGRWPEKYNEVVIVLTDKNQINDLLVYSLGLRDNARLKSMITKIMAGEETESEEDTKVFTYDDLLNVDLRLIDATDLYKYNADYDVYEDMTSDEEWMEDTYANAEKISVVGIAVTSSDTGTGGVIYTPELTRHVIEKASKSVILKKQMADKEVDVFSGNRFDEENEESELDFNDMISVDEDKLASAFKTDLSSDSFLDEDATQKIVLASSEAVSKNIDDVTTQLYTGIKQAEVSIECAMIQAYIDNATVTIPNSCEKWVNITNPTQGCSIDSSEPVTIIDIESLSAALKTLKATYAEKDLDETTLEMINQAFDTLTDALDQLENVDESSIEDMIESLEIDDELKNEILSAVKEAIGSDPNVEIDPDNYEQVNGIYVHKEYGYAQYVSLAGVETFKEQAFSDTAIDTILSGMSGLSIDETNLKTALTGMFDAYFNSLSSNLLGFVEKSTLPSVASSVNESIEEYDSLIFEDAYNAAKEYTTLLVAQGVATSLSEVMEPITKAFSGEDLISVDTDKFAEAFNFDMNEDDLTRLMESMMTQTSSSYSNNILTLGYQDEDEPTSISIYFKDFESKTAFLEWLDAYNEDMDEEKQITYTDITGLLMSSVETIINSVTYVLIAFVSISLVVSSIMIAIITLISVMERTKEIGILRAMGASKRNVSSIFNAETFIIGLLSGCLGIGVTYALLIPINIIIHGINSNITAILYAKPAIVLIIISVLLTLISGLIPSRSAAKKDPVIALRTE